MHVFCTRAHFERIFTPPILICVSRCCWGGLVRPVGLPGLRQSKHPPTDIRAGETLHNVLTEERGNNNNNPDYMPYIEISRVGQQQSRGNTVAAENLQAFLLQQSYQIIMLCNITILLHFIFLSVLLSC